MNIKQLFLEALLSPSSPAGGKPERFLGNIFEHSKLADSFFHVLAGGSIHAVAPYSFDVRSLPCYMILYTKNGCGKLRVEHQIYTLNENTFLLLDCQKKFRIDIAVSPWEYQVLFFTGDSMVDYCSLLSGKGVDISTFPPFASSFLELEKLLSLAISPSTSSELACSAHLHSLLSALVIAGLKASETTTIAPYLLQIRDLLNQHFQDHYSLDELADTFHVSKYKLCREFGEAFGDSPIQYLNKKRIEAAKHLLFTTSLKIHEVGSQVGIDNTNHFITLFKKCTGQTPLEYKQAVLL